MRRRILIVMSGLTLAAGASVGLFSHAGYASLAKPAATASGCGGGADRWYTHARSGQGRLQGTGAEARTWKHWNVAGHASGFSDEAVWLYDANNPVNSLEVGFVTGLGATNFSNKMYSYYTTDDGAHEHDFFTELPRNKVIWISASSNGHRAWAFVYKKYLALGIHYGVARPRVTYEQAEVNFHNIPMGGGGAGASLALEFKSAANAWLDWGYIKGGRQRPYKIELLQPNGAVEGGNGSRC